ncbi:hypothetical protein NST84_29110 [Paenibacillus sp. FSL R7-0345]|uniref:hypothetical protein n=1 Tax=Paenibacillus sp. FSL R7-0345 TaxID=2954535 RepID=UPI00315A2B07
MAVRAAVAVTVAVRTALNVTTQQQVLWRILKEPALHLFVGAGFPFVGEDN